MSLRIGYETAIGPLQANASGASSDARGAVRSTPGVNYTLAMATNLATPDWTALVTNSPARGTFMFTDTGPTNHPRHRTGKQRRGEQNTLFEAPKNTPTITQSNP